MLAVVLCCGVLSATVGVAESRYTQSTRHLLSARKTIATWEEADETCKNEGATLASPTDLELFKYMKDVISINNHSTAFFIGIKASHCSGQPMQFVSREGIPVHDMPNEVFNTIEQLDLMDDDCLCMTQFNIHVLPCLSRLPYFCYKNITKHSVEDITSSTTVAESYFPIESSTLTIEDSTTKSITESTAEPIANIPSTTTSNFIYSSNSTEWSVTSESITDSTTDVSSPSILDSSTISNDIYSSISSEWSVALETDTNSSNSGYTKYYTTTGSCYKNHDTLQKWDTAQEVCRSEGGDLVVINDKKEAELIMNLGFMPSTHYPAWIGLQQKYNKYRRGFWRSVLGDRINQLYNEWIPYTDHPYECGVITILGLLDDIDCTFEFTFICERKVNCTIL